MIYRKVEISIYYASNSDRLIGDLKAWGDGNFVDVLGAYDFDSRLVNSTSVRAQRKLAADIAYSISNKLLN